MAQAHARRQFGVMCHGLLGLLPEPLSLHEHPGFQVRRGAVVLVGLVGKTVETRVAAL
jgi:hypothetical protein